jgi:phosphoglycerate dehydrogenase-like enzyme
MAKLKAALFYNYPSAIEWEVFGQGRREKIAALTDLYAHVVHAGNFDDHAPHLADLEVIFATWGMMNFTAAQRAKLPKLKVVSYAAGNVKAFAPSLIDHGIVLVSAWAINAIPPAEMCLSQVLLSLRGYFRFVRQYREMKTHDARRYWRPGVMDETIGLIGLGYIGTLLRKKLADYPLHVIAHDPFLTKERAAALDMTPVSLEDLFARSYVVSNHIPDLPTTRGVLTRKLFESMRDSATFINTGRGAQVLEADMIAVLKARPDLTALLDVTLPEPPPPDSELWRLSQCRHHAAYLRHYRT